MKSKSREVPTAVTIAGSDSGGGAGVQADLKTFGALGVHGTSVITCITAQNPRAVLGVQAVTSGVVEQQWEAVRVGFGPVAVKTGMLYSESIVRRVAAMLAKGPPLAIIVDPVMISTSGTRLLRPAAIARMQRELLPLAELATPNLDEAELLTGMRIREPEDLRQAARVVRERYGCAALIKGGHLAGREAIDVFWDGREELLLTARRVNGVSTHGTGCTYSAAITAYRARGFSLVEAVVTAKRHVTAAIAGSVRAGGQWVLDHFPV